MTENVPVAEDANANTAAVEKRTDGADLDALLAEFDQGTKTPPSPPEPNAPNPDLLKLKDQLKDQVKAELKVEQETSQAVKNLVKSIRGEVSEDAFNDDEIEDWLEGQAKRNEQLREAWMQRAKNPGAWKKIEASLSNKLNNKFGKPRIDPDATADRDAVAQAVRGASQKVTAEPAPDFSRMTDYELNKWKSENMR